MASLGLFTLHTLRSQPHMQLPQGHVLALPRPSPACSQLGHAFDTTTLAAHDFDVDARTGFMPPDPPVARLPADWAPWEDALDRAIHSRLSTADSPDLESTTESQSQWHVLLRQVSLPYAQLPLPPTH
jgi:indoleamine 2,3-dioxygenase